MSDFKQSFSPLKQKYHYNSATKELEEIEGEFIDVNEQINSYPITTLDSILDYNLDILSCEDSEAIILEDYRDKLDIAREAEEYRTIMVEKYNLPLNSTIKDVVDFISKEIINVKENLNEKKKNENQSFEKSSESPEET